MDTHTFHITYSKPIDNSLKLAIDNVFDNFYNFLSFNKYQYNSIIIKIGEDTDCHFHLSELFEKNLINQKFEHEAWFKEEPLLIENGKIDYLGTCFYMINSLQEYAPYHRDELDRFSYESSYQYKFSCAEKHLVLNYFQEIALIIFGNKIPLKQSQFILSHDIDFIHSSWKDQMKQQVKHLSWGAAIQTYLQHLKGVDEWQNIEEILALEQSLGLPSLFFWLGKKGNTIYPKVKNADYEISEAYVQRCIQLVEASPLHQNGLHKSISQSSFEDELSQLPPTSLNRYHYLKFDLKKDFEVLSKSPITQDHSLGFSKQIGFRNSYGLPYRAFDPIKLAYYDFIVYPLHIMDSSLFYYMECNTQEAMLSKATSFIRQHKQSCVLGILWHNNFFEAGSYLNLLQLLKDDLTPYHK